MSDWKTSTCDRSQCPYDAKENAIGALGGHSPGQCIQSLREQRLELTKALEEQA